ncbi:MAG: hypothetical protein H7832_15545 [Magnetococcus sp. DMHC-6]
MKTIQLSHLKVDLGNYRIKKNIPNNQRETIKEILINQGDKLVKLAKDILDNGLNPSELLLVTPDNEDPGHFFVKDGNRRLTAIKLMHSPEMAGDLPHRKDFDKLSKKFANHPIIGNGIECYVESDQNKINLWIERRHNGELSGIGTVQWTSAMKGLYDQDVNNKDPRVFSIILNFLQEHGDLSSDLRDYILNNSTNVDRLFSTPSFRDALGIQWKNGTIAFTGDDIKAGVMLLQKILERMNRSDFTVKNIMDVKQRDEFAKNFIEWKVIPTDPSPSNPTKIKPSPISSTPSTSNNPDNLNNEQAEILSPPSTSNAMPEKIKPSGSISKPSSLSRTTLAIMKGKANRVHSQKAVMLLFS